MLFDVGWLKMRGIGLLVCCSCEVMVFGVVVVGGSIVLGVEVVGEGFEGDFFGGFILGDFNIIFVGVVWILKVLSGELDILMGDNIVIVGIFLIGDRVDIGFLVGESLGISNFFGDLFLFGRRVKCLLSLCVDLFSEVLLLIWIVGLVV